MNPFLIISVKDNDFVGIKVEVEVGAEVEVGVEIEAFLAIFYI
jgi:hypothetical protein